MQIPLLHQQILIQTERLRDLHRSIMMHNSSIPASEMESMLQEIRKLYGLAIQLDNENALNLLNDVQIALTPKVKAPPVIQAEQVTQKLPAEDVQKKSATENGSLANMKADMHVPHTVKAESNSADKKKIVSDIHDLYPDAPTLGDRFADHTTLAEKIAGPGEKKRVSDNLRSPVKDIKVAIGLNEKFQFINQLFNGDAKKYNSVIDVLNTSSNAETAMEYIKEISDTHNWELHAASARSFIDIIERRFSA